MFGIVSRKKRYDIETLPIGRVLNKEHLLWKNQAENVRKSYSQTPSSFWLITQNNPYMQEILLKIRYFERQSSKSLKKVNFVLFFWTQSTLMDQIIKNKTGLATSRSSGYKTKFRKIPLFMIQTWSKFDDKAVFTLFQKLHLLVYAN